MTSIITLCWNHWKDITKPFVDAMILYHQKKEFELVLWDNGSSDETKQELKNLAKKYSWIKTGRSEKNIGFGAGNNHAYKLATEDMIVFMNNDVLFGGKDWLQIIEDALKRFPNSLVGAQLVKDNTQTIFRREIEQYINGWCIGATRKCFEEIGLFDESFGLAYFEDVELCVRAKFKGYYLTELNLDLTHLGSKSSDQLDTSQAMNQASKHYVTALSMMHAEKQKRIVFFVPEVPYPFLDGDYEGKGVGGAEGSLILLSRALAKKGYRVEIYNKTQTVGEFNGVIYKNLNEFKYNEYCDVFILFRSYHPALQHVFAATKLFWSCDQYTNYYGTWITQIFPYVDQTISISPYHKEYLSYHYGVDTSKITVIDLGLKWEDYKVLPTKIKGKAIFCSVPQRGLDRLAKMCDAIKERFHNFQLVITSDYRLWGLEDPNNQEYREMFKDKPYVTFLGKVSRSELVKHQLESEVMIYPSNYEECFCISALECLSAGAVPVTIDYGALSTTVGESGIVLSNTVPDEKYIESVIDVFYDDKKRLNFVKNGREKGESHDWNNIANHWVKEFERIEQVKKEGPMIQCQHCTAKLANSYVLNKHMQKVHDNLINTPANSIEGSVPMVIPTEAILRFKRPIEVYINGKAFLGTEVKVPYEYVDTVIEQARNAFGEDVVI